MDILKVVVLGALQGLTEFLPVSSSGHIVLVQQLIGLNEPELLLVISLHAGTLIAVFIVFRDDIRSITMTLFLLPIRIKHAGGWHPLWRTDKDVRMLVLIVLASLPTAFIGLFLRGIVEEVLGATWLVGIMLFITGTMLWATRNFEAQGRPVDAVTFKDALIIGTIQGLSSIPGISRSGATISAALFLGINRGLAGRFSFLLSIPTIFGALMLEFDKSMAQSTLSPSVIATGTMVAAVVGWGALKLMLHSLHRGRLYYFAPYCWMVGSVALTSYIY